MGENQSFVWDVLLPNPSKTFDEGSVRRTSRARVTFSSDGLSEAFFLVPIAVAKRLNKRKHEGFSPQNLSDLNACIDELEQTLIRETIAWYINKRDYTTYELSRKLHDKGYKDELVAGGISWSVDIGLVNNARVADVLIRSKVQQGWGEHKIAYTLKQKGIDPDTLDGWPEAYISHDDELERARALAWRKIRTPSKDPYAKIVRALTSKGFNASIAYQVACEVTSQLNDEKSSIHGV